jgi:hypothetical protein
MHNARFRLMATVAGATMCLFAATSQAQNTNTTTGTVNGSASTQAGTSPTTLGTQPGANTAPTAAPTGAAPTTDAAVTPTDNSATTNTTDNTNGTTDRRGFPWWLAGLVVLVALGAFGLMRRGKGEVRRDTYASPAMGGRNVGTGSAADDRMNLSPRAASGTGTGSGTTGGGTTGSGGSGTGGSAGMR